MSPPRRQTERQSGFWAAALLLAFSWQAAGQGYSTPVRTSWVEDPATTLVVTWDTSEAARGTVRYGLTTNYTHTVHDGGGIHHHAISLCGLLPGTRYYYEASSTAGDVQTGTWRTAPLPAAPLHFVVHGDLEGGLDVDAAQEVSNRIVQEDPPFVLHLGDLAEEGYTVSGFSTWSPFFQICSNELSRAVFMPIMGNHDDPGTQDSPQSERGFFHRLFSLPEPSLGRGYYGFKVGNVRFIALNTEGGIPSQNDWLARELQDAANDADADWIVTYAHRPPYSWGERSGEMSVQSNWAPLLVTYEADWMISGHSHNWQRMVPIRGVQYLVAGGGGGRLYASAVGQEAHAFATTCYHHASFHITNHLMQVRGVRSDGFVFDTAVVTNRRHVRVEPAFPRRGEPATIRYRPAGGPLDGASAVYLHMGIDDFTHAEVSAPMVWQTGGQHWACDVEVPNGATQRIAFVFRDHGGAVTNWHNNHDHDWQALLDRTRVTPNPPMAGSPLLLQYEADMGPMPAAAAVSAWISYNGGRFAPTGAVPMTGSSGGRWEAVIDVPPHARRMTVLFSGALGEWDDNHRHLWTFPVAGAAARAWPPAPVVATGSPVVSEPPESGVMNNVGDNMDLEMRGPPLRVLDAPRGFGDFGSIWINADDTHLYVGGIGTDLGGSNNVAVLFLGLDTLTDNAWNLWHKSGPPLALDVLHNVRFTEPMDIAIVYGDQYGDRATDADFVYGGYNFGQGIFYLSSQTADFGPMPGARLSQFAGEGSTPVADTGNPAARSTTRWEAAMPWSALGASGPASVAHVLACGIVGSSSVSTNDRYLSRTVLGERAWGARDGFRQYGHHTLLIQPQRVHLLHGDFLGDGISNAWRMTYFGTPDGPPADEDTDGDGFTNREEEAASTNPMNPDSRFGVDLQGPALTWNVAAGRLYDVLFTPDMKSPFQPHALAVQTNAYLPETPGFYRLRLRR